MYMYIMLAVVVIMLGTRIADFIRRQGGSQAEQVGGFLVIAIVLAIIWFVAKSLGIITI